MKIKISSKENNYKLVFFLPTSLIKTRLFWNLLNNDCIHGSYYLARLSYRSLKKYIKANGHFTLIDIQSNNNIIEIKV